MKLSVIRFQLPSLQLRRPSHHRSTVSCKQFSLLSVVAIPAISLPSSRLTRPSPLICLSGQDSHSHTMSDFDSRPVASRGRSSTRGGRAGYQRSAPRQSATSSTAPSSSVQFDESLDDQGELGHMKKTYSTQLSFMRDMFPDWTDDDLVFAIAEADGDVQIVIDRITQGALPPSRSACPCSWPCFRC